MVGALKGNRRLEIASTGQDAGGREIPIALAIHSLDCTLQPCEECSDSRHTCAALPDDRHASRGTVAPGTEHIDIETACKQLSFFIAPVPIRRIVLVGVESLRLKP